MTTAQRDAGPRASAMQGLFEGFRAELDDYNDRRERLIKASRDVTTASKRLIFLLHRFPHAAFHAIREGNGAVAPASLSAARRLLADGYAKRAEIVAVIVHAAQSEGLAGVASEPSRGARYDRAFGGGLEEFVRVRAGRRASSPSMTFDVVAMVLTYQSQSESNSPPPSSHHRLKL